MPRYAIKVGEMKVTCECPISDELRKAILDAVRVALESLDGDLGAGAMLVFEVAKD